MLAGAAAFWFAAARHAKFAVELPEDAQRIAAKADAFKRPLGAAVSTQPAQKDPAYLHDLIAGFTSITPENAMKWELVEPSRGEFHYGAADSLVDLAHELGKRVRGHPALWDQQLPSWVRSKHWSAEDMRAVIRKHVGELVGHYRGRVAVWDAVNEPLENDGSLTRSVFFDALGEHYIDIAFAAAHEADPRAKLFLNELSAERGAKLDALVALAGRLKQRGVAIDGVGLQNHTNYSNPPSQQELSSAMRRFEKLGLAVEITEMDVVIPASKPTTPALLDRQAAAYASAAQACARAPNCTGLTVWGVTDRYSWLGAPRRPLLYDDQGKPKPALEAVTSGLGRG